MMHNNNYLTREIHRISRPTITMYVHILLLINKDIYQNLPIIFQISLCAQQRYSGLANFICDNNSATFQMLPDSLVTPDYLVVTVRLVEPVNLRLGLLNPYIYIHFGVTSCDIGYITLKLYD